MRRQPQIKVPTPNELPDYQLNDYDEPYVSHNSHPYKDNRSITAEGVFFGTSPLPSDSTDNGILEALQIAFAVVGTVLNLVVICWSLCNRTLRHSNSTKFIISLSVSDLITCAYVMMINALNSLKVLTLNNTYAGVHLCATINVISVLAAASSSQTVTAIAIDRYLCISNPIAYYTAVSAYKIIVYLVIIWIFSLSLAMVPFYLKCIYMRLEKTSGLCIVTVDGTYQVLTIVIAIFIPIIVVTFTYFQIFKIAQKHIKARSLISPQMSNVKDTMTSPSTYDSIISYVIESSRLDEQEACDRPHVLFTADMADMSTLNEGQHRQRMMSLKATFIGKIGTSNYHASLTLTIIVGLFVFHWLPFGVICILEVAVPALISFEVRRSFLWLVRLNSCWNPLVYALSNPVFRQHLILRLQSLKVFRIMFACFDCQLLSKKQSTSLMFPDLHRGKATCKETRTD